MAAGWLMTGRRCSGRQWERALAIAQGFQETLGRAAAVSMDDGSLDAGVDALVKMMFVIISVGDLYWMVMAFVKISTLEGMAGIPDDLSR